MLHRPRPAHDLLPPSLLSGYERLAIADAIADALADARLARRARVRTALGRVLPHRRH